MKDCKNCQSFLTRALRAEAERDEAWKAVRMWCGLMNRKGMEDPGLEKVLADLEDIGHRAHGDTVNDRCRVCLKAERDRLREVICDRFTIHRDEHAEFYESIWWKHGAETPAVAATIMRILKQKEKRND